MYVHTHRGHTYLHFLMAVAASMKEECSYSVNFNILVRLNDIQIMIVSLTFVSGSRIIPYNCVPVSDATLRRTHTHMARMQVPFYTTNESISALLYVLAFLPSVYRK